MSRLIIIKKTEDSKLHFLSAALKYREWIFMGIKQFQTHLNIKLINSAETLRRIQRQRNNTRGVRGGPDPPPPLRVPSPERLRGDSFNITSACISLPQARHSLAYLGGCIPVAPLGVPGGALPPPGKLKIKRKLRLKSNTWQWQRLRICWNSLLIQGERSFSLLKRILHYTRWKLWRRADLTILHLKLYTLKGYLSSLVKKSWKCLCKQIPENCSLKEMVIYPLPFNLI